MVRNESDTAWKEMLDAYFKDCIDYCLPKLSELINWKKPCVSLDKELQAITHGVIGKRLFDKGFSKKEVGNLYKFIDWLIGLPRPLELEYLHDVYQLERANMAYISTAERIGMEKGIEKVAQHLLEEGLKPAFIKKTTGLSLAKIKKLQQKLNQKDH